MLHDRHFRETVAGEVGYGYDPGFSEIFSGVCSESV